MDLVVNHTSDQHEWFKDSRSSINSVHRDWYIWRKPKYDAEGNRHPPNNWAAAFGGSAWEYDEASGEYYLHLFAKEQPDLNWENEEVRNAVHDIVRFWLDKGVDGFRMDVINFISKDQNFPDAKVKTGRKYELGDEYFACGPRLHEYLKGLGDILKEYDAFSVGEMPCVQDPNEIIKAVGGNRGELNMIFNFEHVDLDHGAQGKLYSSREWPLSDLYKIVNKWQEFMQENDGWNALYLENHDQPRSVSRYGNDSNEYRVVSAKMVANFLAFQQGSLFVYQGQELGMRNIPKSWDISRYRDLESINHFNEVVKADSTPEDIADVMYNINKVSRDNARTPMQWNNTTNGGFTTGTPWIELNEDFKFVNATTEIKDKNSVFSHWQKILKLRKELKNIFIYGWFKMCSSPEDQSILVYKRIGEDQEVLVVCNFDSKHVKWTLPENYVASKVLVGNYNDFNISSSEVELRPYESVVLLK